MLSLNGRLFWSGPNELCMIIWSCILWHMWNGFFNIWVWQKIFWKSRVFDPVDAITKVTKENMQNFEQIHASLCQVTKKTSGNMLGADVYHINLWPDCLCLSAKVTSDPHAFDLWRDIHLKPGNISQTFNEGITDSLCSYFGYIFYYIIQSGQTFATADLEWLVQNYGTIWLSISTTESNRYLHDQNTDPYDPDNLTVSLIWLGTKRAQRQWSFMRGIDSLQLDSSHKKGTNAESVFMSWCLSWYSY